VRGCCVCAAGCAAAAAAAVVAPHSHLRQLLLLLGHVLPSLFPADQRVSVFVCAHACASA